MKTKLALFVSLMLCIFSGCDTVKHANSTGIVIVGMQQSAKYGKCDGAALDANTMNGILSKYGKPVVLLNNQATVSAVKAALINASKNDLMIFFYSGHGGSDPIGNISEEPDKRNEYLCLYNGYLLDNDIWEIVKQAKGRVHLIFDCCHSETMFRSRNVNLESIIERESTNMVARGKEVNMLCWSGCPDNSYSYGDDAFGGVFTKAIKAAYNKNRSYDKVWSITSTMAKKQQPKKTQIGYGFGGKVFR